MHDEQVPPGEPDDTSGEVAVSVASEFDIELPFDAGDVPAEASTPAPDPASASVADSVTEPSAAPDVMSEQPVEAPAGEPAAAESADEAAAGEPAPEPAAGTADEAGVATDDPEEATARKLALLAEAEAIVATPDKNESGHAPDDRHLTERMRAVESVWRRVGAAGEREAELRARLQELRQAYAAARSRRAEARAVDRARAAETKRALLVQAFALAQQVDPSIAMPAASPPARATLRRRPSPAMLARRPTADAAPADAAPADAAPADAAPAAAPAAATTGPDVPGTEGGPAAVVDTLVPDAGGSGDEPAGGSSGDDTANEDPTSVSSTSEDSATGEAVLSHDGAAEA